MKTILLFFAVLSAGAGEPAAVSWEEWESESARGVRANVLWETIAVLKPLPPAGVRGEAVLRTTSFWSEASPRPWTQPLFSSEWRAGDGGWSFGFSASSMVTSWDLWPETWHSLLQGQQAFSGSFHGQIRLALSPTAEIQKLEEILWGVRRRREEAVWKSETLGLFLKWAQLLRQVTTASNLKDLSAKIRDRTMLGASIGSRSAREAQEADWEYRRAVMDYEAAEKELEIFLLKLESEGPASWRGRKPALTLPILGPPNEFYTEAGIQAKVLGLEAERDNLAGAPTLRLKLESVRETAGEQPLWSLETGLGFSWGGANPTEVAQPEIRRLEAADAAEQRELWFVWNNGLRQLAGLEDQIKLMRERESRLEFYLNLYKSEEPGGDEEMELEKELILHRDACEELEETRFEAAMRLKFLLDAAGEV